VTTEPDDDWKDRAACLGYPDPTLWFPDEGAHGEAGKKICAGCPVRDACLTDALERHEMHGTWGGATERVRRHLRHFHQRCPHAPLRSPGCACQFCQAWDRHVEHMTALLEDRPPERLQDNGPGATHGKASTYARGCRCEPCRNGMRESRRRNRTLAADEQAEEAS
jgi:WhiB family redox-sensing transcriptional regulator